MARLLGNVNCVPLFLVRRLLQEMRIPYFQKSICSHYWPAIGSADILSKRGAMRTWRIGSTVRLKPCQKIVTGTNLLCGKSYPVSVFSYMANLDHGQIRGIFRSIKTVSVLEKCSHLSIKIMLMIYPWRKLPAWLILAKGNVCAVSKKQSSFPRSSIC